MYNYIVPMSQRCKRSFSFAALVTGGFISFLGYCLNGTVPLMGISRGFASSSCFEECYCKISNHLADSHNFTSTDPTGETSYVDDDGTMCLSKLSKKRFNQCIATKRALLISTKKHFKICNHPMSFLNRTSPIVALVSFPGSGNSWVRHLLEQATGTYTGSIYCDTTLKAAFLGEYIVSGNVIVVKTHHSESIELPKAVQKETGKKNFDKAILIVRDLYDALVSEANRRWSDVQSTDKHLGLARESAFRGNSKWDWLIEYKGISWLVMLHTWLKESRVPVHIVQYERLRVNLTQEVAKMLDFLDVPVSDEVIECVSKNGEGHFKRNNHLKFDPFSKKNKQTVNSIIDQGNVILKDYDLQYKLR